MFDFWEDYDVQETRRIAEYKKETSQVRKKLKKGLEVNEIADMLEMNDDLAEKIIHRILSYPSESDQSIAERLEKESSEKETALSQD